MLSVAVVLVEWILQTINSDSLDSAASEFASAADALRSESHR